MPVPLPGGQSDKYGNRYEDRWTVRCVFAVLRDEADAIRLEPPGPEGDGVEFWLRYSDHIEYHQVKRQRTGEGRWTLSALKSAGVLQAFLAKLQDPTAHCVFVSGHAADVLEELGSRARDATSWQEFDEEFLASATWGTNFEELYRAWGKPDTEVAFSALQRIRVETSSEANLAAWNKLEAGVVLAGDLGKAVPVVTDLLREHAGSYLTAATLWPLLKAAGYVPNPWRATAALAEQVFAANDRYIASRERNLIGGQLFERPEADQLRDLLAQERIVLLDGAAGMGKSDVLLQFVLQLARDNVPYLAFRLDRTTPTSLPENLGRELGLPGAPPIALSAFAQDRPGVLVIDQLDVVSTTSGRNPEFFDCVVEMITLALSVPTLRVVLVCRTFDIENDARLRRLIPRTDPRPIVTVGPLDDDVVDAAVTRLGYEASTLTPTQRAILAVPLHLSLLSEVAESQDESARVLDFAAASDLYEAFWKRKREEVERQLGRAPAWTQVLDAVTDHMSEAQVLRAPRELVDEWESDAEAMVSSRVLNTDGGHLAFFHETFFDYVFARRFAARGRTVRSLLASDQFLFRRAQVRQLLAYSRGRAQGYADDLEFLLDDSSVRFHLRDLVVSWLAQVEPSDAEWDLLRPHLDRRDSPLHNRAWQTLASRGWFASADARGYIAHCLAGDDATADLATQTIGLAGPDFLDRAAELLRPHVGESPEWLNRIWWTLRRTDLAASRPLFDLFVEMLDSGVLDEIGVTRQDFWYVAHNLPDTAPELASELLGCYLENRIRAAEQSGVEHPFERNSNIIPANLHLLDFVGKAAQADPHAFIQHVWPPMHRIIETALREARDGRLQEDDVWPRRHIGRTYGDLDDHLLLGAERAFRGLAAADPDAFAALAAGVAHTNSETVVYLVFEGYAEGAERFADEALESLTTDPRRLRVGYSNGDEWQTRRLLHAVTPFASDAALQAVEPTLLSYFTSWEKSAAGHKEFGLSQFALLGGVHETRRTPAMRKRFAEWQRKFLRDDVWAPEGVVTGTVHSPIGGDAARKMSDRQWLRAIARYIDDDFHHRRGSFIGGADQLAGVLEAEAKADPDRFAWLACRLPDDANIAYFDAILRGVAGSDSGAELDATLAMLERCHALPNRPCGRWIAPPLRPHAESLPDSAVQLLTWYATNDPDPDDASVADYGDTIGERLLNRGLNSVRGGIAYELARLIWAAPELRTRLTPAITRLAADPVMSVRAMTAEIALVLLRDDSKLALEFFDDLLDGAGEELFVTHYVREFIRYRLATDFARFLPTLDRMLKSDRSEVQRAASLLVSIAALSHEEARDLAVACTNGTEAQRVGAATVFAANITEARYRESCLSALIRFFDDPVKDVRDAAAQFIRRLDDDEISAFPDLIAAFNESTAGSENWDDVLFALIETTRLDPEMALDTCRHALDQFASEDDSTRSSKAHHADQISQILVRVYANGDRSTKNRALDLIDRSLALNLYGVHKALLDHDRPWLTGA